MKKILLFSLAILSILPFSACKDDKVEPVIDRFAERRAIQVNGELCQRNIIVSPGYNKPTGNSDDIAVDLGIGVKFAAFNLGATEPTRIVHGQLTECGDYFHWAGIVPNNVNSFGCDDYHEIFSLTTPDYTYDPAYNGGLYFITKYCFDFSGVVKDCVPGQKLLKSDDAAFIQWGSAWRMPTPEDFEVLFSNIDYAGDDDTKCLTAKWDDGYRLLTITSKTTNQSLTFPYISQDRDFGKVISKYWTNQLSDSKSIYAVSADISSQKLDLHNTKRCVPCFIRPVLAH